MVGKKRNFNDDLEKFLTEIDIIYLDERMRSYLSKEEDETSKYREQLKTLETRERTERLSYRESLNIKKEKYTLQSTIDTLQTGRKLMLYLSKTSKVIERYWQSIQNPVVKDFLSKKSPVELFTRKKLVDEFVVSIKEFLPSKEEELDGKAEIKLVKRYLELRERKKFSSDSKYNLCSYCDSSNIFVEEDYIAICRDCNGKQETYSSSNNFRDAERINNSKKHGYEKKNKKNHFRDTIKQYQATQNRTISSKVYRDLENCFEIQGLSNPEEQERTLRFSRVTKNHIFMFLQETGNTKHYEDVILLHNYYTGTQAPDISSLECELLEDFDKLLWAYENLPSHMREDRVNFINSQYVLYQLLRRRGVEVDKENFSLLKTRCRLVNHDEKYSECCKKLNWGFKAVV